MSLRPLLLMTLLVTSCQGEAPPSGGVEELAYDGGALDGSEDDQVPDLVVEQGLPTSGQAAGADEERDPARQAELEALAAAYETMPIDDLLASMGLARDEETQMMDLPDETIRQLAIARLWREAARPDDGGAPRRRGDGHLEVRFRHLSLDDLDDEAYESVMDDLMRGEERFPEGVAALDGERVEIVGYMIPEEWQRREVTEFMLVRDLLACCFGGAPQPDEWIHVSMEEGRGSPYFPFVAVSVTGTLRIEGIDDGAGYAAGCFRIEGTATEEL